MKIYKKSFMTTFDLLKIHFSKDFILNDGSNRNTEEIIKLVNLCENNPKFLIYIRRNKLNNKFFLYFDEKYGYRVNEILLFEDNYLSFKEITPSHIYTIKRRLQKDINCVICFESFETLLNANHCTQCGVTLCKDCSKKIKECPVCKSNSVLKI